MKFSDESFSPFLSLITRSIRTIISIENININTRIKVKEKFFTHDYFAQYDKLPVYSLYPPSVKVYQSSRGRVSRIVPRVKFSRDRADNALLRHLLFPCISLR